MTVTAVKTLSLTPRVIRERVKAILEADANLNGLSADTAPTGPPVVLTSFRTVPGRFPCIQFAMPLGAPILDMAGTGRLSEWTWNFLFSILTRHGDMDRAQDDAVLLFGYIYLALSSRPGLQTGAEANDAIVTSSKFGQVATVQEVVQRDNTALTAIQLEIPFFVNVAQRRR